jgi:16S rRNA G966 N2-methylase RsmD
MVEHAIRAGDALVAVKAQLKHGEWLPWLDANFDGSERTARVYMQLAKRQTSATLEPSILKALTAIAIEKSTSYSDNASGTHTGTTLSKGDTEGERWQLLLGDFRERLADVPDGSVDAIVTDPPYPKEYLGLWDDLGREASRLLTRGGVLLARCGHLFLPDVLDMLREHLPWGWLYIEPLPGSNVRFQGRKIAVAAQPWIAFSNGPWPSGRLNWHPDLLEPSPRTKSRYVWEQKPTIAAELTATFVAPGGLVLDPFAGSGAYGEAALAVGCRWLGVELDPKGHRLASERLA